jgi:sugar (pentulose or hexulose) kinase
MLCEAAGVKKNLLPEVMASDKVGGKLTRGGAAKLGLVEGLPMLAGIVDTSAAMLLSGAAVGQFANNCGSTDVLGLLTSKALPHEKLLTRALGVGEKWMSVQTIAAAGSSLQWAQTQLFPDLKIPAFYKLVNRLAAKDNKDSTAGVRFEPYLAGERTSVTQKQGSFTGLTLSTTREQLLSAMIEALASASAARIDIFKSLHVPMKHRVMVTGGGQNGLADLFHRDWPGKWNFYAETEATLRGLCKLVDGDR